jgi:hypothetical protein
MGDAVDLGFEIEDLDDPKVILAQGRKDDVRRLLWVLEGRTGDNWIGNEEEMP